MVGYHISDLRQGEKIGVGLLGAVVRPTARVRLLKKGIVATKRIVNYMHSSADSLGSCGSHSAHWRLHYPISKSRLEDLRRPHVLSAARKQLWPGCMKVTLRVVLSSSEEAIEWLAPQALINPAWGRSCLPVCGKPAAISLWYFGGMHSKDCPTECNLMVLARHTVSHWILMQSLGCGVWPLAAVSTHEAATIS
ncbi:hypothetical protein Micbo1qcDRAFT_163500 [Microdochium bolleyi]|uniref:Uncharacterized protein n=1 Tax=Microdochium bolleyi TaxID=196109 RepID=A0A136J0X7_9PEZI|nr:hypothetical protein Micbo1qcDRAFT_163500 [Microdochium bolleyi]